jgi:hypothetical protein
LIFSQCLPSAWIHRVRSRLFIYFPISFETISIVSSVSCIHF